MLTKLHLLPIVTTIFFSLHFCRSEHHQNQHFKTVQTPSGPIEGKIVPVNGRKVVTYFGVPFAEPPLGNLRFRPPKMVRPWRETLRAHELPKACVQTKDTTKGVRGFCQIIF